MLENDGSAIVPRRRQRITTNFGPLAAARINKDQLQQLKEAFNLIDQDRDGIISKEDLRSVLISLGQKPTDKQVKDMLSEAHGCVDFARFLSMFSSKMGTVDTEELIRNAFTCFDEDCDGMINLEEFKEMLMTMGLRLTEQQVRMIHY